MSAATLYRISFEVVAQGQLHRYCDADPIFYKNVTQLVPNSEIPDEHWQPVSRETTDPWTQYRNLKRHVAEDRGFVRSVKLEKMVSEPRWERVEDES